LALVGAHMSRSTYRSDRRDGAPALGQCERQRGDHSWSAWGALRYRGVARRLATSVAGRRRAGSSRPWLRYFAKSRHVV